jgi:hypothetical protein
VVVEVDVVVGADVVGEGRGWGCAKKDLQAVDGYEIGLVIWTSTCVNFGGECAFHACLKKKNRKGWKSSFP